MKIVSKAPGRICLFGDHQDYLQLPIIACAIDRAIQIKAIPNERMQLKLTKKDLQQEESIDLNTSLPKAENGDYIRLALQVLARHGCMLTEGYDLEISGDIPINAGLSSSSALTIAWVQFLLHACGSNLVNDAQAIARLAYEIEVLEQGSGGGKMDQYTIANGHLIFLDTKRDRLISMNKKIDGLIVGVSGVKKDTLATLSNQKENALKAIDQVKTKMPAFDIEIAIEKDIAETVGFVEDGLKKVYEAAIKNHAITKAAWACLQEEDIDMVELGRLMSNHHALLRDNLHITVPRIDDMINGALQAGAYGAKIVGSGGGGCIVAMAPPGKESSIIEAIKKAGAVDAFLVKQAAGCNIIST